LKLFAAAHSILYFREEKIALYPLRHNIVMMNGKKETNNWLKNFFMTIYLKLLS